MFFVFVFLCVLPTCINWCNRQAFFLFLLMKSLGTLALARGFNAWSYSKIKKKLNIFQDKIRFDSISSDSKNLVFVIVVTHVFVCLFCFSACNYRNGFYFCLIEVTVWPDWNCMRVAPLDRPWAASYKNESNLLLVRITVCLGTNCELFRQTVLQKYRKINYCSLDYGS